MGYTTDDLVNRLTTPYSPASDSNNRKLMAAFAQGYWASVKQGLDDIVAQGKVDTMTEGSLDKWAMVVNLVREPGETDSYFRIRVKTALKRLVGGVTIDALIDFCASLLGCERSEFTLVENNDGGVYEPATVSVSFNLDLLGDLGFAVGDYATVAEELSEFLTLVAAAGVRVTVTTEGGAQYDVDSYDVGVYGQ